MNLFFYPRKIHVLHPNGWMDPFPFVKGNILGIDCLMLRYPTFPEDKEISKDVQWTAECIPIPFDEINSFDDFEDFYRIEVDTLAPRQGTSLLGFSSDPDNIFLTYALQEQSIHDSINHHLHSLEVNIQAIVIDVYTFLDSRHEKGNVGIVLPYGERFGKLIRQEIEIQKINDW